jgi:hypothetical protein
MTTDIFGRRALEFGGSFAADSACIDLTLNCLDGDNNPVVISGLLTQQLSIQYQQPITRLYEVGSQRTYYVAGRPQGSASLARVLGPNAITTAFYTCLGDVCNADRNDMCFCVAADCLTRSVGQQDGCGSDITGGADGMNICLKNVVMQSLGFGVQAQDMIINENLSLMFTAMLVQEGACECPAACDVTCRCFT